MRTPDDNIRAIRALQAAASSETRAHFAIEADGSFLLDISCHPDSRRKST